MKAVEMFEALGFERQEFDNGINYILRNGMIAAFVRFYDDTKEYQVWTSESGKRPRYGNMVCPEWHKAITKQLEELGWLE